MLFCYIKVRRTMSNSHLNSERLNFFNEKKNDKNISSKNDLKMSGLNLTVSRV